MHRSDRMLADLTRHNRLPEDSAVPSMDSLLNEVKALCTIIAKHNVQNWVRIRLLHRHVLIPDGHIMLGRRRPERFGYWTRPTPVHEIDKRKLFPHIISVNKNAGDHEGDIFLCPSEFRIDGEDLSLNFKRVTHEFLAEFTNYVCMKSLENTFGLQALQGENCRMIEFSFDTASILLDEKVIKIELRNSMKQFSLLETSWVVTVEDGLVDQTNETRCVIVGGKHVEWTNSKAKDPSEALSILRDEGFLNL